MSHIDKVREILPQMMAAVALKEKEESKTSRKGGPEGLENCSVASMAQGNKATRPYQLSDYLYSI